MLRLSILCRASRLYPCLRSMHGIFGQFGSRSLLQRKERREKKRLINFNAQANKACTWVTVCCSTDSNVYERSMLKVKRSSELSLMKSSTLDWPKSPWLQDGTMRPLRPRCTIGNLLYWSYERSIDCTLQLRLVPCWNLCYRDWPTCARESGEVQSQARALARVRNPIQNAFRDTLQGLRFARRIDER